MIENEDNMIVDDNNIKLFVWYIIIWLREIFVIVIVIIVGF